MEVKGRDLLSDLPDEILLHHIISFLQVKDILRLRSLSRRFHKTLSITVIPSFCFSDDSSSHNCSCTHISDFMINTVLKNRPHTLGINRISFSSSCKKNEHCELHEQWIIPLFEAFHVDELSLDYKIPGSLHKFQSLKVLKLNLNLTLWPLRLPQMKLASLETLHMKSVRSYDSLDEWISQSFPSLKHLVLQQIINPYPAKQEFTIRSSSLEDLAIIGSGTLNKVVLDTFSPNLHSLTGNANNPGFDEETLETLQASTVSRAILMSESDSNVLIQLFKAICLVRELHIDTQVLQNCVRILRTPMGMIEDLHGEIAIILQNLCHLKIHIRLNILDDEDYFTFLERLPSLETLTLINDENYFYPNLERSVRDNFKKAARDCGKVEVRRTKGLKKVKLITRGFNYRIVILIGWLMKSCIDLEEMNLHYPSYFDSFMMREGLQDLVNFQRASHQPPSFHFFPKK